ncbi:thaumarchaeosortase [Nitrosopumilus sp.]|uniref:thaumarchaeosortase n=1 Tax=Nitrosopumilus sp. TaxID=2024843 RepID=UPI0029319470|nr:thaumarchaeosortase [Nitrosopumilus sp.]
MNWNLVIGIIITSSPILFAFAMSPESFDMSWNQGRGDFLFALVFVVAELVGLKIVISQKRLILTLPLVAVMISYFIALEHGLKDYLLESSKAYDIQLIDSWVWMWDFMLMSLFTIAVLSIYFGTRWIRIAPAAPIFLGGSAVILSLDAFFPYDSLGPLQYVVPYLVQTNVWLVTLFDLGTAVARDNVMFLKGDFGGMALQVFWPSAGIHSIIIYSLVMGAFLLKMNIPRNRKSVYFALGIAGTIGVNVIRIFSLSWYAMKVTTDAEKWEAFHDIAGGIMFLPWLFVFLFIVIFVETRRAKKSEYVKNEITA